MEVPLDELKFYVGEISSELLKLRAHQIVSHAFGRALGLLRASYEIRLIYLHARKNTAATFLTTAHRALTFFTFFLKICDL
jgi:hypothetical protein